MSTDLSGRNFLKLLDFTPEEISFLVQMSCDFKEKKHDGKPHRYLEGRNIALLFEKTSTRTRCSFEVAAHDLGMGATYLDSSTSQMGEKESIADTACVLGRMYDGIAYRGYDQAIVEDLAAHAGVPVWNALTTEFHPTQMIADLLTIGENFPQGAQGLRLVFMGDARNNVGNSLMVMCSKMGMHFVACGPVEQMPADDLVARCREIASETGGSVTLTDDVSQACTRAHIIYTDIWLSMGEPADLWEQRIRLLEPYRVTPAVMDMAADDAIFMHCLPSFHDTNTAVGAQIAERFGMSEMEVSDEVFSSSRSRVFDEAENRMHSIKAIMYATMA